MWTGLLIAFGLAMGIQDRRDPMDLLRWVEAKVLTSLDRMPRYMCTQTIDRDIYESDRAVRDACDQEARKRSTHRASSDRLRLDVAMISIGEMYSWVGENKFSDQDLLDMVHEGAISTGSFGAFLSLIFRDDDPSFTYEGEQTQKGRTLAEFGFRVPLERSHYKFDREPTGYEGTLLVDTKNGELVQLMVRSNRLPSEAAACYSTTTLDYGSVRLKNVDFLLPRESRLQMLRPDGGTSDNRTVFSGCHEFLGESKISYEAPSDAPATESTASRQPITIPPGLSFQVSSAQKIDPATAAVGDLLQLKLTKPIRDESIVLVPAGASVTGRIVRLRQFYGNGLYLIVALSVKLESVTVGDAAMALNANASAGGALQPKQGQLQPRVEFGTLSGVKERSASFQFRIPLGARIRSGLESQWVTAKRESP